MRHHDWLIIALIVLLSFWVFGLVQSMTFGGYLHLLLIASLLISIILFIQRRALEPEKKKRH